MIKVKAKRGRPPISDLRLKVVKKVVFLARAIDLAALEALQGKNHLDCSQVIREALARNVDFEGLRSTVAEKATLLAERAVSSAG